MGDLFTPEEVKAQCVAGMPAPLGELYYAWRNELASLHLKWKDFRELFAESQETIDLLNNSAPKYFAALQSMMWESVLLHLCRLTDPLKSGGKHTFTVLRLEQLIPDQQLKNRIASQADEAVAKTRFARDWRNRRLAHRELPPLAEQTPFPLAHASRQNVEDALAALRRTLNSVSAHYLGTPVAYEHSIEALGGVSSLLMCLKEGHDARRIKLNQLVSGKRNDQ